MPESIPFRSPSKLSSLLAAYNRARSAVAVSNPCGLAFEVSFPEPVIDWRTILEIGLTGNEQLTTVPLLPCALMSRIAPMVLAL